ncbi:MAG: FtsX-like permease family protein [Planctomycetota bacterium]
MSVWRLVIREIAHRKLSFALGAVSVLVAVGVVVGQLGILRAHDLETERVLAAAEARTRREMRELEAQTKRDLETMEAWTKGELEQMEARTKRELEVLQDDYRQITKKLGFNILILPKGQELSDFYAEGYASKFMPEDYADRLAESKVMTVRHILPILEQKVTWPERKRKIVVCGVRGEVPLAHRQPRRPILQPVPEGTLTMGYELWGSLGVKKGDTVRLLGRDFTLHECLAERGTKDDITVWLDLKQAQELLDKKNLINAILALECLALECQPALGRLPDVRKEIASILPDTQVKEIYGKALARLEARQRAMKASSEALARAASTRNEALAREAKGREHTLAREDRARAEALARKKDEREQIRHRLEAFAAWLVPVVVTGCVAWVALLAYSNVRTRRGEIAILRAIGTRSRQIAALVLARALLTGLVGALVGCLAGAAVALAGGDIPLIAEVGEALFEPLTLVAILLAAPIICGLAAAPPALAAGRQDPAVVLQEE